MRYATITFNDTVNGDGLRVTLWCQGCKHHCQNCHNPQLWDFKEGNNFTKENSDEIINYIKKHTNFIQGLSLLGGDPMDNAEELLDFIKRFKRELPTKDIWIWSGYTFEEIIKDTYKLKLLELCNVLVDGEFKEELKDLKLKFRGSSNQRVIDIQKSLKENKIILYLK